MVNLNKMEFLMLLSALLYEQYGKFVVLYDDALYEIAGALKASGQERQFLKKFEFYLSRLKREGDSAIGGRYDPMEHLFNHFPLCSMRFLFSGSNLRILFVLHGESVYLLHAFYERSDSSATSYESHIPTALERLDILLREESENE